MIGTAMPKMIKVTVTLKVLQMVLGLLLIKRKSKAIKKILWIKEPLKRMTLKIIRETFEMDPTWPHCYLLIFSHKKIYEIELIIDLHT